MARCACRSTLLFCMVRKEVPEGDRTSTMQGWKAWFQMLYLRMLRWVLLLYLSGTLLRLRQYAMTLRTFHSLSQKLAQALFWTSTAEPGARFQQPSWARGATLSQSRTIFFRIGICGTTTFSLPCSGFVILGRWLWYIFFCCRMILHRHSSSAWFNWPMPALRQELMSYFRNMLLRRCGVCQQYPFFYRR